MARPRRIDTILTIEMLRLFEKNLKPKCFILGAKMFKEFTDKYGVSLIKDDGIYSANEFFESCS